MKQIAQNYKSGELSVLDVPAPVVPSRRRARAVAVLAHLHRHRDDEADRGQDVDGRQGAGAAGPGAQGPRHGCAAGRGRHLQEGDEPARLLHAARLLAVRRRDRGGARAPRNSSVGQLVAAAGNEYALHAEYNWVPVNLCAAVPQGVLPEHAAFSTVGAIAMHGVRRAEVQLGDTACVIGLGLVGQLVVRLLVASGVRVIGLDVIEERCRLAEQAGAVLCAAPDRRGHRRRPAGARRDHRAGAAPTTCSWPRAGRPTGRSRPPPGWPGTGPASSTSARPAWTCRGTPTTTRNSTSGSPGPTDPGATTTATSSRASTTRPATSAGPSGATWSASSTSSRARRSRSRRSSPASSRWRRRPPSTPTWPRAR